MAKKTDPVDFTPDPSLAGASASDQPEPVPVTIVPPRPLAAAAIEQPEPEDPSKKTPEGQINVPPPAPEDPKQQRFPSDAVPVGQEHKTPAAQQRAAEKVFAGEDPGEPDEPEGSKKGKK